jgi:hypothetical protein
VICVVGTSFINAAHAGGRYRQFAFPQLSDADLAKGSLFNV